MAVTLSKDVLEAIQDQESSKILITVDKDGVPHGTSKGTIHVNEKGQIVLYELIETSQTQKNLVYSLWFGKKVAISVVTKDRKNYLIKGAPYKDIISGREFQKVYVALQEKLGEDTDLSSIWLINVEEVREQTYSVRREQEKKANPIVYHLDQIAKEEYIK